MEIAKLTPDRDLQCFFFHPSAIAAISGASADGFTVSGTWRQQFDWAVIEWNRDNVYEHPALRNLPDGDLSALTLTYEESRTNCIALDSDLFPTIDWPYLRVWAGDDPAADPYFVKLKDHAEAIEGSYQSAYADFTLSGTAVEGEYVGLGYLGLSYTYQVAAGNTLEDIVKAIADGMNGPTSPLLTATRTGTTIRVLYPSAAGANGNRFGVYSSTSGSATWDATTKTLANGTSPTKWRVTIDFSALIDRTGASVPTNKVRKLRWTYAADPQASAFARSEFTAVISTWSVTGSGRTYSVAGPGSRRFEDNSIAMAYTGSWSETRGNFSSGTIHSTVTEGDAVTFTYSASQTHTLYLGTRYTGTGANLSIAVDGGTPSTLNLRVPGEDVLIRWPVSEYGTGTHTVTVTHTGPVAAEFYFDFVEMAVPATTLPSFADQARMTLATDWDTDHSLALAPERTAWLIDTLGFKGRQNNYVGALWFYELVNPDNVYASGTMTFGGTPEPGEFVSVFLGRDDDPPGTPPTEIQRGMHGGDTLESIAISFAQEINRGYTGVWASVSGSAVTITSRSLGADGNHYTLDKSTTSSTLTVSVSAMFSGGNTGAWRTDLAALPRLNRAVRDWSRSFFGALHGYGIDAAAAFSTELRDVDPAIVVGMVQRGPSGDAILLQTPAYQTNFSPTSLDFWKQVYLDAATIQADAGLQPYLQFGEVQWWYFPNDGLGGAFSGMPFYDAWTAAGFESLYGRAMTVFSDNTSDPAAYPDETAYLPVIIGNFTDAIMAFVRATYSNARFEVLYPLDVNQTSFNRAINYPATQWTAAILDCLKTEGFGFTLQRNLQKSESAMQLSGFPAFPPTQRSHLVGLGDATTAWLKEARYAQGNGFESVVLFALDQMCLIGYALPLPESFRRSVRMGS
jgi:hypothetical protein